VKKLGLIVNPIAGMGGRCGLKGTDGAEILERARSLGGVPEAPDRAATALRQLAHLRSDIEVVTVSGDMGETEAIAGGFEPVVLLSTNSSTTTSLDTRRAAKEMTAAGVDLLLFVGGDGTARDVYASVNDDQICLGVPAGCKIHSGVYGVNPRNAGELAALFLSGKVGRTKTAEVMDIDEEAFRQGRVSAELYGYLRVPEDEARVQGGKAGRVQSDESALDAIAYSLGDRMEPNTLYVLGTGSTLLGIEQRLGIEGTLLGVDVTRGRQVIATDVNERQILELLKSDSTVQAKIVVTVIGGQGYVFGRGNQQISPEVIQRVGRENVMVVATKSKIAGLGGRPLLVDTGSEETNALLSGYMRVTVGYDEQIVIRVAS
jgi:predicted polyphosphate/ATP-dependent NAD kinase